MMRLFVRPNGVTISSMAIAFIAMVFVESNVLTTVSAQEWASGSAAEHRSPTVSSKTYADYVIIGAVERVRIEPQNLEIRAKIDTGAKSSSIDAKIIERFRRVNTEWVRFLVFGDNGVTHKFELPITRYVRIRRAGVPREDRPAVTMRICLGSIAADVLVNFAERRELNYRLLLGRDFLTNRFLIDVGSNFLTRPNCGKGSPK